MILDCILVFQSSMLGPSVTESCVCVCVCAHAPGWLSIPLHQSLWGWIIGSSGPLVATTKESLSVLSAVTLCLGPGQADVSVGRVWQLI